MSDNRDETAIGRADPGSDQAAGPTGSPGAWMAVPEDAVLRRTRDGWRVGGADVPDLTCAMVLADLLAAELAADHPAERPAERLGDGQSRSATSATPGSSTSPASSTSSGTPASSATSAASARSATPAASARSAPSDRSAPPASPATAGSEAGESGQESAAASETSRLTATVRQLEHALTARVRVEQAIGVLAERHRIQPRQAFEQLRTAARNRGRRVIDIASDVVASATNPLLQLPDELSRPRSSGRNRARQPHSALETE